MYSQGWRDREVMMGYGTRVRLWYSTLGQSLAHADMYGSLATGRRRKKEKGGWAADEWRMNDGGMMSAWLARGWMDGQMDR